jgi:integrase
MFHLARRARLVDRVPAFELMAEKNVRKGFMEESTFQSIRQHLPARLQPGELLSRRWCHVDLDAGWLRLEPGETKNGEGRTFRLTKRLRATLEAQRKRKLEIEKRNGRIIDALFFHHEGGHGALPGEPVRNFRGAWDKACKAAGVPGQLFHDFRRTAARSLIRAGVAEPIAMKMTGHLTPSIFKRYGIVDATLLTEGSETLDAYHEAQRAAQQKRVGTI